jgi:hypothetical protein
MPLADLLNRLKQLPANSVVFVIRQTMRDHGQDVDSVQSLDDIVRVGECSVFHMNELGLGPRDCRRRHVALRDRRTPEWRRLRARGPRHAAA